jgi:hypothetical protein
VASSNPSQSSTMKSSRSLIASECDREWMRV